MCASTDFAYYRRVVGNGEKVEDHQEFCDGMLGSIKTFKDCVFVLDYACERGEKQMAKDAMDIAIELALDDAHWKVLEFGIRNKWIVIQKYASPKIKEAREDNQFPFPD